ncbi:MAG: MmgE/PrpD family protein [Betaproteobacteria bacterium]|nr:MmgE/PrpD family protein [Betaproteobacteria bacterium]
MAAIAPVTQVSGPQHAQRAKPAGLTGQLAQFIAGLSYEQIPPAALESAKRGIIDWFGVLLAGRDEPVIEVLRKLIHPADSGEARLLFDRGFAQSTDAALINGAASHALDYDDTGLDGHPSVVLATTMLAEGERLGTSGRDMLAAYAAGYETWGELSARDSDRHHGKGWHPTALFGTLAAAAVAARLNRLDTDRCAAALGIAASMAAGLVSNFGSMTKPFQAGRAAQNGILAAQLAGAGLTASADALEHPNGFLMAVSPAGRVRLDGQIQAGRDWYLLRQGINIKRYPVCYSAHRAIDAILALAARHAIVAAEVAAVNVSMGRMASVPLRQHRPRTALDAKFSIEFCMACALVAGRVGMAELTESFLASAPIQVLMPRVSLSTVEETDPDEPLFAPFDRVVVTLLNGSVLTSDPVRHVRGHARNPIELPELREKFSDCIGDALLPESVARLFERLGQLETLPDALAIYTGLGRV